MAERESRGVLTFCVALLAAACAEPAQPPQDAASAPSDWANYQLRISIPRAQTIRFLIWREYDSLSTVQEAIVCGRTFDRGYFLAQVAQYPPRPQWRLASVGDPRKLRFVRYPRPPNATDVETFLSSGRWKPDAEVRPRLSGAAAVEGCAEVEPPGATPTETEGVLGVDRSMETGGCPSHFAYLEPIFPDDSGFAPLDRARAGRPGELAFEFDLGGTGTVIDDGGAVFRYRRAPDSVRPRRYVQTGNVSPEFFARLLSIREVAAAAPALSMAALQCPEDSGGSSVKAHGLAPPKNNLLAQSGLTTMRRAAREADFLVRWMIRIHSEAWTLALLEHGE